MLSYVYLAKTLIFFAENRFYETHRETPDDERKQAEETRARTNAGDRTRVSLFTTVYTSHTPHPSPFQQQQFENMPISLPGYSLGDEGKPDHFEPTTTREQAAIEAKSIAVGDAAFIKRSDLKWTYAVVNERAEEDGDIILRFDVDKDKNRKSFPQTQWGKYIRVIKVASAEDKGSAPTSSAAVETPAEGVEVKEEEPVAEPEEVEKDETPVFPSAATEGVEVEAATSDAASEGSAKSTKKSGWLESLFAGSKKEETVAAPEASKEEVPPTVDEPAKSEEPEAAVPIAEETSKTEEPLAPLPAVDEENEAKENSECPPISTADAESLASKDKIRLTSPKAFLPSPKTLDVLQESASHQSNKMSSISLKKKNSFKNSLLSFGKIGKKNSPPKPEDKKVIVSSPPASPTDASMSAPINSGKKEWFDPNVFEVDYDKNPTDLFQALEARQFSYAEEMFRQTNKQFNKECKTWVVARAQKKTEKQLRFRALPLHAALVFGAPDDMIKNILNAYPLATRGRDVKGRLPIHLAYEHESSDDVVQMVLEAFPRGFLAKDKKEMTPLEYIGGNSDRAGLKKSIPLILSAKVEEERAMMAEEKANALAEQKKILHEDPEFMEHIITAITEDVETTYAGKMELVERNYQKEIELLKKKHDSETQALLEGFEVKLNFERKLIKLKNGKGKGFGMTKA